MTTRMLVSRPETARLLGVSVDTVRRMVEAGKLQAVYLRPNAHPRFRVRDVEALAGVSEEREEARVA